MRRFLDVVYRGANAGSMYVYLKIAPGYVLIIVYPNLTPSTTNIFECISLLTTHCACTDTPKHFLSFAALQHFGVPRYWQWCKSSDCLDTEHSVTMTVDGGDGWVSPQTKEGQDQETLNLKLPEEKHVTNSPLLSFFL